MSGAAAQERLIEVTLDERTIATNNPTVEEERASAIRDLLAENRFAPCESGVPAGPYRVHLSLAQRRLVLDVRAEDGREATRISLSLAPFRRLIRDYFFIVEQYYGALRTSGPDKTEAIDMGRRAVHNEGAGVLQEKLAAQVEVDLDTARRLFTLVCVLHLKG